MSNIVKLCEDISSWAMENISSFIPNGFGRQYIVMEFPIIPEMYELKLIVMDRFNIPKNSLQEPIYKDLCGINLEGASVHMHQDPNSSGLYHVRFNVMVSKPISGGEPIHDGNILDIKECEMWRCEAGTKTHGTLPVVGNKPRIIMSYGFLLSSNYINSNPINNRN